MSGSKVRIAVLISGGGTTLKNLLEFQAANEVGFEVGLVISSSAKAAGLDFASQGNIPSSVVRRMKEDETGEAFSENIFGLCDQHDIQLVVMGGFLKHLLIPDRYQDRVINIHPSLIPAFCGQGFYGSRVHQAVLDYGCKVSGCTVHLVDNQFDHGPILAQATVPVKDGDDAQSLQQRVFATECELYPKVIDQLCRGKLVKNGRWISIQPADQ